MSIHKLNLVIYLSLSVALCGQVVAQDGSGTATPTAPAAQAAPAAPDEGELKDKFGLVMGYNLARNWKRQNPDGDYAQVLEGINDAFNGTNKDGYVFGYNTMSRMKKRNTGLTADQLAVGIRKAMAGEPLGVSDQEAQMLGMAFSQMVEKNRIADIKKKADDNRARGAAYITAQKASNPNLKELSDGIYYEVLKEGSGDKPGENATVSVNYTGSFVDGKVFDSSVKPVDGGPGKPAEFRVGRVIPGFSKSLMAMTVGSKWRVIIPGDQAYGPRGSGGKIGPVETLVFELELLEIIDPGDAPAATAPKAGK